MLWSVAPLDREQISTIDLVIKASEDCWSGRWELVENQNQAYNESEDSLLWVQIDILDINDNAPRFTKRWFTAGVTRDTQFGEPVMDLSVSIAIVIFDQRYCIVTSTCI